MWRSLLTWSIVLSSISMVCLARPGAAELRRLVARSGAETGVFVELYTSEG